MSDLLSEAVLRDVRQVRRLLAAGANVHSTTTNGFTPLHLAALDGRVQSVRALLAAGANVHRATTSTGMTPLHFAAMDGHVQSVHALLAGGADVNATSFNGTTPLALAIQMPTVRYRYQMPTVRALLNAGAQANGFFVGYTYLHIAVSTFRSKPCRPEIVHALLKAGADVNVRDCDGKTPIISAVMHTTSSMPIVRALLDAGAQVNVSFEHLTPLHIAVLQNHVEVTRALLDAGAEVDAFEGSGVTPLHIAAQRGLNRIVRVLLAYGANVDLEAKPSKKTALHFAAQGGHEPVAHSLLAAGADVNKLSTEGTPMRLAARSGHNEVANTLLRAGGKMPTTYVGRLTTRTKTAHAQRMALGVAAVRGARAHEARTRGGHALALFSRLPKNLQLRVARSLKA